MSSHKDTYALKAVTDLPVPFRSTFSFRYSNSLLSECFPTCYFSDVNMVISAPTGSGKTVLFELCIMRLLSKFIDGVGKFSHHKGTLKTIYIVPPKALVHEKVRDWIQKLGPLGINCLELTGDNEHYSITNIQDADIILTTPEKLDGVTRSRIKGGGLGSTYSVGEEVCHGSLSNLCVPRFSNQPSLENGTDYLPASDEPQNEAKNPPLLRGENSRGTEPEAVHNCGSISNALLPCLACDECLEAKKRAQENSVLSMAKPIIQRPIAGSEVMSSPCVWQR